MDYSFINDLNNAAPQNQSFSLIPAGTLIKASVCIKPGGHGPGGWFTQSRSSDAVYLNVDFTVVEGEYSGRIVHQMVGIQGTKRNDKGEDIWGQMGRSMLRALVESAYNIMPNDNSDEANIKRTLQDISGINTLVCAAKVGVDVDSTGAHPNRNKIVNIITPESAQYKTIMGQASVATATTNTADLPEWLNQ